MELGEGGDGPPGVGWLIYDAQHRVMICRTHGYAIPNIDSHLKDQHRDIKARARTALVRRYEGMETRGPADMRAEPHRGYASPVKAVEGLPILPGFACLRGECEFLTISWKCLRVHFNEAHGIRGAKGRLGLWTRAPLQTFFTGPQPAVRYYCVTTTETADTEAGTSPERRRGGPADDDDLVAEIKQRWMQDQEQQEEMQKVLADGAAKHEITNWLKRSGWVAHFAGRDLGDIYACSRMPGPGEREARRLVASLDGLFFARCIGGLKSMPLMTRLLLASPHPQDAHSRPFGPLQEKTSMERYIGYWKRFLCYCLQVLPLDQAELRKQHGFSFTVRQRGGLEQLREHLQDENYPEEGLEDELLQVSASFWTQRLGGDPFDSPLWHFVAVLGIDGESVQLRPAHLFTYVLAGLVYVGRALLAEYAIPTKKRDELADLESRFAKVRNEWLCKATYSPMGYVLSLLLYGRKIARETGSRLMASWSREGNMMYFMGKPLYMDSIRGMVTEMLSDAEDILWKELMFKEGGDVRFSIPLAEIEDDLTNTQRGKSFVHTNGLAGKEVEMLEDLVRGKRRDEFLEPSGQWRWEGIRRYQKRVRHLEELCAVATQMSWGAPARGDEIGGLRRVNGINRDRGAFIVDGEFVLVTQYHKSLAHFDSPKVIPRFLPHRLGQLLAMYMVYIRPLTDRWEADRWALYGEMKPPSDFIWHDENGPWEGGRISKAMARWSYHYMGTRLTLQDWRHVAIAISKKHARRRNAAKPDFDEDTDEDEAERYEVPDDLAAAHSTETSANYGVTIDVLKRLTAGSLEMFGHVSRRWHGFLGLDQPTAPSQTTTPRKKRDAAVDGRLPQPRAKRPRIMSLERPAGGDGARTDQVLLKALRAVLRDDHAQFRTPQQEEAVRLAAAKETPLVAVLPTGGGKSLTFMVPAMLEGAGVTVVVAPFAELKRQLVGRCTEVGLDCKAWPEARDVWPRVTIVSAEAAASDDFRQWAADLSVRGGLDRVVIDECHLTFTAADEYRSKLRGLVLLRNLGCPFVFLTGTLPPLRQREFEEAMLLQNPLYIRASSHRLNAQYSVTRVKSGRGVMKVKQRVLARRQTLSPGEKGVIYCTSHAKCRALARQLDCHYYHGGLGHGDAHSYAQREEGFRAWTSGETPYIVATAALGTGIDVPGITHVIHLEAPYSIIDYAQEAGRAGRAGERVAAEIIVEDREWPAEEPSKDGCLELKVREVNSLIRTQGCRRRILGQHLDGDLRDCQALDGIPCDNCHRAALAWKSELTSQGLVMSMDRGKKTSRALGRMEAALEDIEGLGKLGCRICWMFNGAREARHQWDGCPDTDEGLSFSNAMAFQAKIDYRKDGKALFLSCFYCHVSQRLCTDGYKSKGSSCRWKHVVIPLALAATTEPGLWRRVQELAGREFRGEEDFCGWLGRKHGKLVCGEEMTNALAVFNLALEWRAAHGVD